MEYSRGSAGLLIQTWMAILQAGTCIFDQMRLV
jgi:hypothetical protein